MQMLNESKKTIFGCYSSAYTSQPIFNEQKGSMVRLDALRTISTQFAAIFY